MDLIDVCLMSTPGPLNTVAQCALEQEEEVEEEERANTRRSIECE